MPAYVIVMREAPIRDQKAWDTYRAMNQQAPADPKLQLKPLVVHGKVEALEGKAPDSFVVLQFPSMAEAKAWYNSPGYQAALPFRIKAAEYRVVLVKCF